LQQIFRYFLYGFYHDIFWNPCWFFGEKKIWGNMSTLCKLCKKRNIVFLLMCLKITFDTHFHSCLFHFLLHNVMFVKHSEAVRYRFIAQFWVKGWMVGAGKGTGCCQNPIVYNLNVYRPEVHVDGDVSVLSVHLGDAEYVPVHRHCNVSQL